MRVTRKRQRTRSRDAVSRYVPRKMRIYRAPRSYTPSVYRFKRQIQVPIAVNQSTGFFGSGFDIAIVPNLSTCDFRINGVLVFSPTLPSVTEFTTLFDQYRIKKINVRVIFSNNESGTSSPTTVLPVVHQCNDYNSLGQLLLADYQQYPNLKTWQLGKDSNISWSFVPHVRGDVLGVGGALSSSANNFPCPWLDCSSADIQMLGSRFYLNNLGRNTNVDLGSCLFLLDYDLEFKFVK